MNMRERFEAAMLEKFGAFYADMRLDGQYADDNNELRWQGWQAAWTAAAQECARACEAEEKAEGDAYRNGDPTRRIAPYDPYAEGATDAAGVCAAACNRIAEGK